MESISDRLDSLMRSRGIRGQSQLARDSGVGQSTINRILKKGDSYSPSWETLRRLSRHFNVSVLWLAEGIGEPQTAAGLRLAEPDIALTPELQTVLCLFQGLSPQARQLVLALLRELNSPAC